MNFRTDRECRPSKLNASPQGVAGPYNTTVYQRMKDGGERVAPVADWSTKRRWVDAAFRELEADGYSVGTTAQAVLTCLPSR